MLHGNMSHQRSHFIQFFNYVVIGVKNKLAGKMFDIFRKFSRIIHRRVIVQSVFQTYFIVFLTVAGRDMHRAGPGFQCDKRSKNQDTVSFDQWMDTFLTFQNCTLKFIQNLIFFILEAECIQTIIEHVLGDNQHLIINLDGGINKIIFDGNRQVSGNSPGCGCPDHDIDDLTGQFWQNFADIGRKSKLYINGRRGMISIFYLCLC